MKALDWKSFKLEIVKLLADSKIVFAGVHTEDWFDFVGRAIQMTGYFCHTLYIVSYQLIDDDVYILTLEADKKKVSWHNIDEYRKKCNSGKRELTVGYLNNLLRHKLKVDRNIEWFIDKEYDWKGNIWLGICEIMSWFGNFWKAISGQLHKINPMSEDDKYRCSGLSTRICRLAGYNVCKGQDAAAVTPTEFMSDNLLKKEFKTKMEVKHKW